MSDKSDQLLMRAVRKLDYGEPSSLTPAERRALAENEGTKHLVEHLPPYRSPRRERFPLVPQFFLEVTIEVGDEVGDPRIDPYDGQIKYDD